MGVLYDYFRAGSDQAATELMDAADGGPLVVADGTPLVDAVDLKGLDPEVTLGKLVGIIRGAAWSLDLVPTELIWSSDGEDGPWVMSIDDTARDCLATVDDERLPVLAAQWGQIEELARFRGPQDMSGPLEDVVGLARRARDHGEHLYVWCCL